MSNDESPFLAQPREKWVASNEHAFAIRDGFPVSPGHTLVVPKRLVAGWFEATVEEQQAIFHLVEEVRASLDDEFSPDGYNIGINVGAAAGQTVFHLHVHVIPRYSGDMRDPRGGVRHVIPWMGNYKLSRSNPLAVGHDDPFFEHLRPLLSESDAIDIVAAFVQDSGLELLEKRLHSALARGARIRLICGDYLHLTQEAALRRLLDFQEATTIEHDEDELAGSFSVRIVETGRWATTFHPKSWQFHHPVGGVAFVGSSNISALALTNGVEWNLRVEEVRDPTAFLATTDAFKSHWDRARPLTSKWIDDYAARVRERPAAQSFDPLGDFESEEPGQVPRPHALQQRALEALRQARAEGRERALTVLATGLGKTWLSAFDVEQHAEERGAWPRVLFIAHRAEILRQAARTYRRLLPTARFGWLAGNAKNLDAEIVFASVQKLSREQHLHELAPEQFDYVVVDEVHHATADTYRRVLDHLQPEFMLGLTATPERTDGADVLGLFDDYLAEEIGIAEGIEADPPWLVPFHYFGVKDTVDFEPIPWRNGKFDTEAVVEAVQTEARMNRLSEVLEEHPGDRTVVFCCSIAHALFVREWLRDRGQRAAAIVSDHPDADDREWALDALAAGDVEFVCAVDILNEGVDVPTIDRVVMLRPTESSVVFIQQLGRGLRIAEDKDAVAVIDFVGNHRLFLERLRWLLSIGIPDGVASLQGFLNDEKPELPEGCSIDLEFEAKELLRALLPKSSRTAIVNAYRELRQARGEPPTISELFRMGYDPRTVRAKYGSWFGFVQAEGDVALDSASFEFIAGWLREVETTAMTKCFKAVVLKVLLEHGDLSSGMRISELAARSYDLIVRSPELFDDIRGVKALRDPRAVSADVWEAYWRTNPLAAWANSVFTAVTEDEVRFDLQVGSEATARFVHRATAELVDFRLAQYRARKRGTFYANVIRSGDKPILMFGNRGAESSIPEGEVIVEADGEDWSFRFVKVAVNVAKPEGASGNRLPDLLRGWFGVDAGAKGTRHRVRFERAGTRWYARPVGAPAPTNAEEELSDLLQMSGYDQALIHRARAILTAAELESDLAAWLTGYLPQSSKEVVAELASRVAQLQPSTGV